MKRMQMQSSHICTVGLCFLACKAFSFWSIFQENSVKLVFGPLPYCCFVSYALWLAVCSMWLVRVRGCLSSFLSEAD